MYLAMALAVRRAKPSARRKLVRLARLSDLNTPLLLMDDKGRLKGMVTAEVWC